MRLLLAALYLGLAGGASADPAAILALAQGDMRKLTVHETPVEVAQTPFDGEDGTARSLGDYRGAVTVVNFWATWCAPCREEMPTLSALAASGVQVVTIATGRNDPVGMAEFMAEIGVANLPLHRDPRQALARDMGVLGLPVTLILDPQGREVARLMGDADWSSDSARAILSAIAAGG